MLPFRAIPLSVIASFPHGVVMPKTPPAGPGKAPAKVAAELPPGFQGRALLPLDQFTSGPLRTRDLSPKHVRALAESIAAIGLIHPPAVDRLNRLLAGAHRLAALRWLEVHEAERFRELFPAGVPVWRMDLNADSDVDLALAVEISENEQRRDYRPAEVQRLAERLLAAGFHYSADGGRPRSESRPLMPALEIIVGKSVRQLRRILNPPAAGKTRTPDLVIELKRLRERIDRVSLQLGASPDLPELQALKAELGRTQRLTDRALTVLGAPEPAVALSE
jgi:ParB family chromosome partitioning protein